MLFLKWGACLLLLCGFFTQSSFGQADNTPPNVYTPVTTDTYPNLTVTTGNTGVAGNFSSINNLTDSDITNSADGPGVAIGGTSWIQVTDDDAIADNDPHPIGSYVGFVAEDALLGLGSGVSISIYRNGSEVQSESIADLVSLNLGGDAKVGFFAEFEFDAIRFTVHHGLVSLGDVEVYYAEIFTPDNNAAPNLGASCNEPLPWVQAPFDESEDGFPVVIEPERTGGSGLTIGDISDSENVVNNDTGDSADMYSILDLPLLSGPLSLSVRTLGDDVPGGTFAGFSVSIDELLSVGILDEITITTYNNGTQQETVSGDNLLASVGLLGSSDRYTIGFQTSSDFDEIQITLEDGLLSLDLSVFNVYHAVVTNFCAGAALECQTDTPISTPDYPVFINADNTGVDGAVSACVLGDCITDVDNVINGNPNEGAEITQLASGIGSASISVKFGEGMFASGSNPVFVGFDIENAALLDVDVIDGIEITTYLDGSEQESSDDAGGTLVEANTDLITGNDRRTVGFAATDEFDEVQISIVNVLGVALDETTVYQLILRELCPGPSVPCGETALLEQETYPVIINSERTGFFGAACVGCSVENADALLTSDDTDYATITSTVDLINYASVSVVNPVDTYPANTTAGFIIDTHTQNLVELDLLEALEVCTYNNGTLQECRSGGNLLTLTLLIPLLGPADGIFNVGFITSQPYDEIVFRTGDLASANVIDGTLDVYSSFVDFHSVNSDGNACPPIQITFTQQSCYRTLSSPVAGLTYQEMLDDLWTQGVPNSDYPPGPETNVYSWPLTAANDAESNWEPLNGTTTGLNAVIPSGTGFLISVFEDDDYEVSGIQGGFDKTISISPGPQNGSILPSSMMNEHPEGWTLAGNPLQSNIDVTQLTTNDLTGAFYVYNINAGGTTNGIPGGWVSNAGGFGDLSNNAVAVGQGFFVQNVSGGSVEPSIIFTNDSRTDDGEFYGKQPERRDYMRLEMKGEKTSTSAWIRFSEEGSLSKVYGDALQLMPFSDDFAILASQKEEELMDIGHYPFFSEDGEIEIPVHAESTIPGTYSLSATELDLPPHLELYLKDLQTGESVKITKNFEYTFEINQQNKQASPDQGLSCSDIRQKPTQAKTKMSEPRFLITSEVSASSQPVDPDLPTEFTLEQNYPNPFNPTTNINYQLPQESNILLQVFDITGRHIATLVDGTVPAGEHNVNFDASTLSSGVYIYKLRTESVNLTRKFTLIK